jgi:hypothetical protein
MILGPQMNADNFAPAGKKREGDGVDLHLSVFVCG